MSVGFNNWNYFAHMVEVKNNKRMYFVMKSVLLKYAFNWILKLKGNGGIIQAINFL